MLNERRLEMKGQIGAEIEIGISSDGDRAVA